MNSQKIHVDFYIKNPVGFFGNTNNTIVTKLKDINYLEATILIVLCLVSIIFGFYPEPLLNTMDISVNGIIQNHQNELAVNLINK